jgi:acyl-CoA synthetase (AMP-forming)/AMP-acid ligase II
LLDHVLQNPLGNKPTGGKTSLAGVQDKIVLARTEGGWNRVIDGWPSTHILKPESPDYPTAIYDEEYGARFVRAAGLSSFSTLIQEFEGVPAVVIERYDRSPDAPQGRIHQEDFNQVLGAAGIQKYQKYGGRVSLERVARVFSVAGDYDSLERLFRLVVVSVAVGNLDLHANNLSLLHHPDASMTLSPAYDVVPRAHQPNDGEVALAKPMPSMPLYFWNDPDGVRYRDAYFSTYPGVWRHGDWMLTTERGSVVVSGRSDSTLNRNGVRLGSADIYAVVDKLPYFAESLVIGAELGGDGYWLVLFVVLADGATLTDDLVKQAKSAIAAQASPRHVPDDIIAVPALPHTRTGKKLEIPVKRIIQGHPLAQVASPDAVDDYSALTQFTKYRSGPAGGTSD